MFTCGTSPNTVQENLLPKVLRPKIKPDDSKKRMLILSWKPRWRKVNSLGWQTLLARKSTYACLLLFSDVCFLLTREWKEQCVRILSKRRVYLFAFTYRVCQVLTRPRELTWLESEWALGLNRRTAVVSRINIWITGSALMRMSWRLQDTGRNWSSYR